MDQTSTTQNPTQTSITQLQTTQTLTRLQTTQTQTPTPTPTESEDEYEWHCLLCGENLGSHNPRQYCAKTYCKNIK